MFVVLSDALTTATATALSPALSAHTTDSTATRPRPQTRQLFPAVAAHRAFRCEAYLDKGNCQYIRCIQQTRGGYLIRDGCDAQMMSFSLGGDPSELLLPIILDKDVTEMALEDKQISQEGSSPETL